MKVLVVVFTVLTLVRANADEKRVHATQEEALRGTRHKTINGLHPEENKRRLGILITRMDTNNDKYITIEELSKWIFDSYMKLDHEDTMDRLNEIDANKDKKLQWEEYLHQHYEMNQTELDHLRKRKASGRLAEKSTDDYKLKRIEEDVQRWAVCDHNKDGALTVDEYNAFLHPYEYDYMRELEVKQVLTEYDTNKDGEMTLDEFLKIHLEDDKEMIEKGKEDFKVYDSNSDNRLDKEEIAEWIVPSLSKQSRNEAEAIITKTDTNRDDKASFNEIMADHTGWVESPATNYGSTLQQLKEEL